LSFDRGESTHAPVEVTRADSQPPLMVQPPAELHAAIAGLALGGAERIVLDWAERIRPPWTPHIITLRDHVHEWRVPASVKITRLGGVDVLPQLIRLGRAIAQSAVPVCACHLLTGSERQAVASGGAFVVPVIHNAEPGWLESASTFAASSHVIAVSDASADDVRRTRNGCRVSVIRHIPRQRDFAPDARARWRAAWRIPNDARVIGMIGGVKAQKDYPFAVRLLRGLLDRRDVYLVIVGGPVGKQGRCAWEAILAEMVRHDVRHRLAMPGFVRDAGACLPALDLLLNTSDYEGLSIATLEARIHGIPVVASRVGGQSELGQDALTLVDKGASIETWIDVVDQALGSRPATPAWRAFPSHRLWTLANIARPFQATDRVLIVTANLNAGGAQRSLVNLLSALTGIEAEVAVTGDSTADYFARELAAAGVRVSRTAATRDPFDHAEQLIQKTCGERFGLVCFWNVDPKIKLLVAKMLAFTDAALVDVSPGPSSFGELRAASKFAELIAFPEQQYYQRLDRLVLKYRGPAPPSCAGKVIVIPNGVAASPRVKASYEVGPDVGRVVVNGRIAPSKFVIEIVEAMDLVRHRIPSAELHVFGSVEPRHADYAHAVLRRAGSTLGRHTFFHEPGSRTMDVLPDFDVFVVLGENQGSPNALLEALSAGMPCIANDDGGTREQLLHEETGLLVTDRVPSTLAQAIERLLLDRELARRLGVSGRHHVLASFSIDVMASRYQQLFESLIDRAAEREATA
jgi:glycosyltransferase involved in cell wall biosynthesis